jgi:hypothetical protein
MTTLPRSLLFGLLFILLLSVGIAFIGPLVSIQLRLARNGKIAHQLVQSLETRFPGIRVRGAASYEREVIYLSVGNHLDEAARTEVERWLREQKTEQTIAPQIWLRFEDDAFDQEIIIN